MSDRKSRRTQDREEPLRMKVEGPGIPCFLVSCAGLFLVTVPGGRACPRRCACYVPKEVHCTFRYLSSIPDGIPPNAERINLGYNSLARLTAKDFSGLSRLELLMLHSNGIHTIPAGTFSDLQALQVLKMSYNKVRELQRDTFRGLSGLTRLHVDHNSIEFIHPVAFHGLRSLRLVHLEGNRLTKLHPDTFVSLNYLQLFKTSAIKYVHLSDNFLRTLPRELLSSMPDLESLYLHGNPWVCDCRLQWLAGWIQERPDVIKCKKDRSPSSPQQCPLCTNPMASKGKPLATLTAAAFSCARPVIDPLLKPRNLPVPEEENGSVSTSVSLHDFLAPLGSLTLNLTDQSGNAADVVCSVQRPSEMPPATFIEENDHVVLNASLSTSLVCRTDDSHLRPVWQVLALYSDSPLTLVRTQLPPEMPVQQFQYRYRQVASSPGAVFTTIKAELQADPPWLIQDLIELQLDRAATSLSALRLQFSSRVRLTLSLPEVGRVQPSWTMIHEANTTRLEHTVLAGGTVVLECPGRGDPAPRLEWLLADGSRVGAPYVSGDGRVLVDGGGRLELRLADLFDAGLYHCVSSNQGDADVLTYRLIVLEPRERAQQENGPHLSVFPGDTLDLKCRSSGSPDASVSWVLPGNTVFYQSSLGRQVLSNGTLRLSQVTWQDRGHYLCVAANPSGADVMVSHVSVNLKGQRPEETEGSGLEEPDPTVGPRVPPATRPLEPAPRRRVADTGQRHPGLVSQRRVAPPHRRYREHRRQFSPSARRIDPRQWAAIVEKARKSMRSEKLANTTARQPPLATRLPEAAGEEVTSSGVLPPEEELGVPATDPTGAAARTAAAEATEQAGTEAPSASSPLIAPPGKPVSPHLSVQSTAPLEAPDATTQGRVQGSARLNQWTVSSPHPEGGGFQDGEPLQSESLGTEGTVSMDGVKVTSTAAPFIIGQAQQTAVTVTVTGQPSFTMQLSPSHIPSQPSMLGNGSTNIPLMRRFGRRRKIWGRGRIIGPSRYGFVRPGLRSTPEGRLSQSPAPELSTPGERLTSAPVTLALLTSLTAILPKAGIPEAPAPVHTPPLPITHKPDAATETVALVYKQPNAASSQGTPAALVTAQTQVTLSVKHASKGGTRHPGMSNTTGAPRDPVSTVSSPGPGPQSPVPGVRTPTRFLRRKTPWLQSFANNRIQREGFRNQQNFGLQGSITTELPEVIPALATDQAPTVHFTRLPPSWTQPPALTPAPVHQSPTPTHSPVTFPNTQELPFPPAHPTPQTVSSQAPSTHFPSVQTVTMTTAPITPESAVLSNSHVDRAGGQRVQRVEESQEPQKERNSPHLPSDSTTSTAVISPDLTTTGISSAPSGPALAHLALENTTGLPRALHLADGVKGRLQEGSWKMTAVSEAALSGRWHQRPTATNTVAGQSVRTPVFQSSLPLPAAVSPPWSNLSAVSAERTAPVSRTTADTVSKPPGTTRPHTQPWQPVIETSPPAEARPGSPEFTTGTAPLTRTSLLYSTALPTLETVTDKMAPSSWSENHFWHKPYREISGRDQVPTASVQAVPGQPEGVTSISNWDGEKSGFDQMLARKTDPSELHPLDSRLRGELARPRIVGGRAASFTVTAHADALLPCEAVGNPPPSIRWTRVSSGLDLSTSKGAGRFQVLPSGTLSIHSVDLQDRGQYLCSASNPLGTDRLQVTLSVVSYPPRILDRQGRELTVHSGSRVELRCRAKGRPSPRVAWTLPNQTVVSDSQAGNRWALVTPDGTLVIHSISVYDRGFYRCTASSPTGQDSVLVRVQVIAAPPVILEQKRQAVVGTWGAALKLPCTARGTPQPSVHWVLSDGTEVKPSQARISRVSLYPNGTLHISNVAPSDGGMYECLATSSTGSERRVVILTVDELGAAPRIELASRKWTEVDLGDRLLLNCSAAGEPKPQIIWRLPSKAVVDQQHRMGSRIHVYPNGSLFVDPVTEKDGGDYVCVARNSAGEDLALMHVSLRLSAARIHQQQHLQKRVLHGRAFQVDCKASGSPVPEISWSLPDGTVLHDAAMQADDGGGLGVRGYTLFHNGTLHLNKVGVAEEGDYTCRAQNTLGKDEMKVRLTVITAAPRIRQGHPTHSRVKAGDAAILDCEATGEPMPRILWLMPSGEMLASSKGRHSIHTNGSLAISRASLLDSGRWVCIARNPGGDDTKVYQLGVVPGPPSINGFYGNGTVVKATAVRHSKKHLDCRAEGTPRPQTLWVMPGSVILAAPYQGSRVTVHENGTLEIRNVRLSDAGEFTCVARSAGGESLLVVRLEVQEMLRRPTFRSPSNHRTVAQLGQPVALNCSVDGNPPPEITWILPGGERLPEGTQHPRYGLARNGSLLIRRAAREDVGRYRCAARNRVGYIEKLVLLETGQKPVILSHAPGPIYSVAGEPLWLHCMADGNPKPGVGWTVPSGYVLDRPQEHGRYVLWENGTLVVREATAGDRGNYVCRAHNSVGQAQITVGVVVMAFPPRITSRPPRSLLTRTGEALRLQCVALGVPKPEIIWEMPGRSWLLKASVERTQGVVGPPGPRGTLVIPNPQPWDSGVYTCTAKNPLGSDSAPTSIRVV